MDRDLTDLGEKIKQQQAIIASFGDLEKDFRNLQKRLSTIDDLEKEQLGTSLLLDEISGLVPLDVSLKELAIREKKVKISASVLSEAGLNSFIENLSESKFKKITLENVSRGISGEIKFSLTTEVVD